MKIRTVIVDDHAPFRSTARELLEGDGFTVVGEAADGAEAIALVGRLRPDVVLLDVHLPDTDGFDVALQLGATGSPAAVVLTSSRDGSDFGPLVERSGARGFLAKSQLSGRRLKALLD